MVFPEPSQLPLLSIAIRVSSSARIKGSEAAPWSRTGPLPRFVEHAPDHYARMVAVALDHRRGRSIEPLGQLRRRLHQPTGVVLLIDQQADLVAQIELIAARPAR